MPVIGRNSKPAWGLKMAARRKELGKTAEDVALETGNLLYPKLIYRLENGQKHPSTLSLREYRALLEAYRWTPEQFQEITGVEPPVQLNPPRIDPVFRIPFMGKISRTDGHPEPQTGEEVPMTIGHLPYRADELIAVEVDDEAMYQADMGFPPEPGTILILAPSQRPRPGDMLVGWVPALRRGVIYVYWPERHTLLLRGYRPAIPPVDLNPRQPIEPWGVVVAKLQILRR